MFNPGIRTEHTIVNNSDDQNAKKSVNFVLLLTIKKAIRNNRIEEDRISVAVIITVVIDVTTSYVRVHRLVSTINLRNSVLHCARHTCDHRRVKRRPLFSIVAQSRSSLMTHPRKYSSLISGFFHVNRARCSQNCWHNTSKAEPIVMAKLRSNRTLAGS